MSRRQNPDSYKLADLVDLVEAGDIDVPEIQREFQRKPEWVAALMDSLSRSPEIPIGSLLVWEPGPDERPRGGRYRRDSDAVFLLLDGQGRLTGILAALGIRPPWIPGDKWKKLRGPDLEVGVRFDANRTAVFEPLQIGRGQVPLGEVYRNAKTEDVLGSSGMVISSDLHGMVAELRATLRLARIRIDWMPGTFDDAVLAFERRHAAATIGKLKSEELYLCMLSALCGSLARDLVDPLLDEAAERGLSKSVARKAIKDMMERLLPPRRGRDARTPTSQEVKRVGENVTAAFRRAMNYLAHYGVDRDEVLPAPAAMAILAHLFNAYPEAVEDDFAQRWTVHAVSRNIQLARKRTFLRDVARSTSYRRACEVLADIVPGPMSPFPVERLDYVEVKGGHYGSGGLLYAMASAAGINGTVRDLAQQDSLFWPDSRMRLHPLCLDAERGLVTHHALMSEQSAEILRAYGGWTVKAYEELRCGDALLRAHQLPVPDPAVRPENFADWLTSKRRPLIAAMIDDFQRGVGSLVDHPEDALTLPLGDAA